MTLVAFKKERFHGIKVYYNTTDTVCYPFYTVCEGDINITYNCNKCWFTVLLYFTTCSLLSEVRDVLNIYYDFTFH